MTDFDLYSQKVSDVCALIRQHGKCEEWELFKNSERGLEVLCAIVDAVRAEAKAEVPSWQPIETAPKDGSPILVVANEVVQYIIVADYGSGWHSLADDEGIEDFNPTHWMPIPAAPIAVAEQTKQLAQIEIVPDWPACNPACDYEDPNGMTHDLRSNGCDCTKAKASIARQHAAMAATQPSKKEE